jgi:hypothetical protein
MSVSKHHNTCHANKQPTALTGWNQNTFLAPTKVSDPEMEGVLVQLTAFPICRNDLPENLQYICR